MRVIVTGAGGRMGRNLVCAIGEQDGMELVGATERPGSEICGQDAGKTAGLQEFGVPIVDNIQDCPEADVLIDFTAPEATLLHADFSADRGMSMVIGTTGFAEKQLRQLRDVLADLPALMASNYSVGVNLALQLIGQAASVLDEDYDVEIIEAHHRHKVDAPSGTAISMGEVVAASRGHELKDVAVYAREGITGERIKGNIGFSSIRSGDIVGEHTAIFAGLGERLEIRHVATDRMAFARGAIRGALWLQDKPPGFYDIRDVLGLS